MKIDFLERLLDAAGPSGFEVRPARVWREEAEGFADRSYERDGSLTPRDVPDAVLTERGYAAERAVKMVREGTIVARDGSTLSIKVDTICVHGDTPAAAELAASVRRSLEEAGMTVAPLRDSRTGRVGDRG